MQRLRSFLLANRPFACAVIALALMMKIVMPAGLMPTFDHDKIVVSLCSGTGPITMVLTIPGSGHGEHGDGEQSKSEQPCAFSGLSAPSLAATDPALLTLAIMFIMALLLRPLAPLAARQLPYLRPPLRAPPFRL